MFELPLPIRLPLQIVLWAWMVALPGWFTARWLLRRSEAGAALVVGLSLGFGLVTVPLLTHLGLYLADRHLTLAPPLAVATVVNALGVAGWWRRRGETVVRSEGWLFPLALAAVAALYLATADGRFPVASVDHWRAAGTVNCFMEAFCKYLGIHSHPHLAEWGGVPPWQGIDEKMTMANLLPTGVHAVVFGAPGFRVLRAVLAVMLGALGWATWRHLGGSRRGALVGLAVFSLNPFVLFIHNVDRNVLALAFAALLYLLADGVRARPVVLGLTAGLVGGFGIRMLPVVYLLPLGLHLWFRDERRWRDVGVLVLAALPTLALSAHNFLTAALRDYSGLAPLLEAGAERRLGGFRAAGAFSYEVFGQAFQSHYALAFPFGASWVSGPYNPFPVFLFWPLHVLHVQGAVGVALALLGLHATWRSSRARAITLLAWGLPASAGLSLLAFLIDPVQERLILVALLPLFVFLLAGVQRVAAVPRSGLGAGAVALLLAVAGYGASFAEAPPDPRVEDPAFREYWFGDEGTLGGGPARLEAVRQDCRRPSFLPDYGAWASEEEEPPVSDDPVYARRWASFDAWTDLREPDLVGRCFLCDAGAGP